MSNNQNMSNNQKQTAEFIGTLISELAVMARAAKLDSLSYMLDVARHEASQAAAGTATTVRPPVLRATDRKPRRLRKRAA